MFSLGFNRLDTNNKIKLGLGFSLFILLLSSVISLYSIQKLIDQSKWVDHTHEVMINLEQVNATLKDAETEQRGYLLTGNKSFLQYYDGSYETVMKHYDRLRDLTVDNEPQQLNLDTLHILINKRFNKLDEVIKKRETEGIVHAIDMIEGKVMMDKCRVLMQRMREEEAKLLQARTEEANKYAEVSPVVIGISSLISLLVAALSLYFITRDIKNKEATQKALSRFNYLLEGNAKINDSLRGEKELHVAGNKILRHVCEFVKAQAGVLYLAGEDHHFHLSNTYAFEPGPSIPSSFAYGEGLMGQTASQKKRMLVHDLPAGSMRIQSGLTTTGPVEMLIIPFVHNDETVAVAELVSRTPFSDLDLEFTDSIGNPMAVFINNLKAEIRTANLLAETQSQAEELESQQEEMRQMNDELREQRDRLQASEEELRASEEELQEKNTELELQYESVRYKNQALEDARQALQLKINQVETVSKYKSDFLANMSHELRTPLNSILIFASLLQENRNKTLGPKEVEQAGIIEKSGNDLLKLINEILDLARVEAGKVNLELKDSPIGEFSMEKQFAEFAHEKNIRFTVDIAPDVPPAIRTDRFRLQQILKNLLSNAFKFTPDGGSITYTIRTAEPGKRFNNPALRGRKVISFSVKDSGIGIPEDKRELIFEAFQQADASTTRKYGGSGLGLTISRDLTRLLGGDMELESEQGKGSTFTVYMPDTLDVPVSHEHAEITPAPVPETKEAELHIPIMAPRGNKDTETILIIEDDMYFSNMLADYAANKGYAVKVAHTGREGLEIAKSEHLKAVLLDVRLPDMNGWDILRQLKKHPELKDLPVHMMSAYDRDAMTNDLGQADFISKPMTLEKLDRAFNDISKNLSSLKKVLIVEDNRHENLAIQELLKTHNIEASNAYSGKEALEMLRREKNYDCIILDISLPDLNGYEVLEQVKKDEAMTNIPVIIYSGKDLSEEEEIRFKKYADTIIIKTEYSYTRLLEEVKLFMHSVGNSLTRTGRSGLKQQDALLKDKKVLIADDDMRNIFSLNSLLENHGMQIVVAYDGKQAIQELEANPDTDIVLMDIMMPEMDGIEATKLIRSNPAFRNLPVIAVTAKAMEGDREKCLAAGASDYITKPIEINKLLSLMRVWIYKS